MIKRILLAAIVCLLGLSTSAQLPNGSVAPNFSYQDIEGNTHTLSEYLAQGKWVFIDVFTVWCPNCVNQLPNVEAAYEAFGPDGDNSTVFLAFETDDDTEDDMQHPTANEVYDWLNAFDYPIVNDTEDFTTLYSIVYQPAFFLIRPDGLSYFVTPPTMGNLQEVYDTYHLGCTDSGACNFDPAATVDDGTCEFVSCLGCVDSGACNHDPEASIDDGSCEYESCAGCTIVGACNFDSTATINDGSCDFSSCLGCTESGACNYDPEALISDGSCEYVSCAGCTDPAGCNYDPEATIQNSCDYISCYGCTDPVADNYDEEATLDDGSCEYDADINNDAVVNVLDLLLFLPHYGCNMDCSIGDFNGTDNVDAADLLFMLSQIGSGGS